MTAWRATSGWRCLWRAWALTLAIVISALLVNAVGIIGFIGLFAPLLAKMLGARRLLARLLLAALIGALPVAFRSGYPLAGRVVEVSTGSVTALIGAPLLLWLLPRLRSISAPVMNGGDKVLAERQHVLWFALGGWRFCCWRSSWRWPLVAMPTAGTGPAARCWIN
jgi:iron complex transport system permease protein